MLAVLFSAAIVAAAPGAATAAPAPPNATASTPPVKQAEEGCAFSTESVAKGEIVVCAQRPQGYRLNPDVMTAKKAMRGGGKPNPPNRMKDSSCTVVGPMGCGGGGIDLLAAAVGVAKMGERLSKGQEIGSMFVTTPTPDEYQLYLAAKKEREAKGEEAKVQEAVKATAAARASQAQSAPPPDAQIGDKHSETHRD
jgi:hypothetical protein